MQVACWNIEGVIKVKEHWILAVLYKEVRGTGTLVGGWSVQGITQMLVSMFLARIHRKLTQDLVVGSRLE